MQQSQIKLQTHARAAEKAQKHKGQLALQPSKDGQESHKGKKTAKTGDLLGHSQKPKKKNRLGQRARQQLGREKQAQLETAHLRTIPLVGAFGKHNTGNMLWLLLVGVF